MENPMLKNGRLWLLSTLLLVSFSIMTGCSGSYELSRNDVKKKDVDGYKNKRSVTTNILSQKTSLTKVNLESLSSSIAGFNTPTTINVSKDRDEVMYKVIEYLNTPYLWGGTSKRGIDCSGFVQAVMFQALGVALPRTSYEQSNVGVEVAVEDLKFGDLLFFDTRGRGRVSHVGIYLGDGYFVHSGSKTGVAVASLDSDFYSRVFLRAKRVLD
ncbi:MAG: C40 family peptidase [Ignavibacteriae bacterium]|nr:C40 family peptidase [Ignavibacteriota bacterium]